MPITPGAGSTDQSRDFALNSPPQESATPSTLAGVTDEGSQAPPDSDEGLKQIVQQVRQMQVALMELARQFPAAASSLRSSADGLRSALRQIIASPGAPEPPAPPIGG